MVYKISDQHYFRIHHIRPRFKNDVEKVLIFIATEIAQIPESLTADFAEQMNSAIKRFPGNATKSEKTINNWRTEISSLFGFIQTGRNSQYVKPGLRAIELEIGQDLIEAFKKFLYFFQYPGGHVTPSETCKCIEAGVKFKPAKYILSLLDYAEKTENKRIGISKAALTHCVFNDLRVTRDQEKLDVTWERIKRHHENHMEYDTTGDVIRYAGDILDYMEIANLLVSHNGIDYYLNKYERESVEAFINSKVWFDKYDYMISRRISDFKAVSELQKYWFDFVNSPIDIGEFKTDLSRLHQPDNLLTAEPSPLPKISDFMDGIRSYSFQENGTFTSSKEIGDVGEGLVFAHESEKLKNAGRTDLLHLVKIMPTNNYLGYDIISYENNEQRRHIEVKTTISSKPVALSRIHLTTNEWRAAETYKDRYFIYRVSVTKAGNKMVVIQDPVGLYKAGQLYMVPRNDGADLFIDFANVGNEEELLSWTN